MAPFQFTIKCMFVALVARITFETNWRDFGYNKMFEISN